MEKATLKHKLHLITAEFALYGLPYVHFGTEIPAIKISWWLWARNTRLQILFLIKKKN